MKNPTARAPGGVRGDCDLPVEGDYGITITGGHWLVPGFEIEDLEPGCSEGNFIRFESGLTIGSAMGQKLQRAFDAHRRGPPLTMGEANYSTQGDEEPLDKSCGPEIQAAVSKHQSAGTSINLNLLFGL